MADGKVKNSPQDRIGPGSQLPPPRTPRRRQGRATFDGTETDNATGPDHSSSGDIGKSRKSQNSKEGESSNVSNQSPRKDSETPRKSRGSVQKTQKHAHSDRDFPMNWQRKQHASDRMATPPDLTDAELNTTKTELRLQDGKVYSVGDHVYVQNAYAPGEPWFVARIMEFLEQDNSFSVRLNWLYRPQDVHRRVRDPRELYLTFHADVSPATILRGICEVRIALEMTPKELETYRQRPSCFWVSQLWDRNMERLFEIVPSAQLTNLPEAVRIGVADRYKAVVMEPVRARELRQPPVTCVQPGCGQWCAGDEDSLCCARCDRSWHVTCLDPPPTKLPPRGYGWRCEMCYNADMSRQAETAALLIAPPKRKKRARASPDGDAPNSNQESQEAMETPELASRQSSQTSPTSALSVSPSADPTENNATQLSTKPRYEAMMSALEAAPPPQQAAKALWPFRYLGIHSRIEDAFDLDDRIYPRGSSQIGMKYQASVVPWPGKPVQYVPRPAGRPGRRKRHNAATASNDTPWVQIAPKGYIERGGDSTSTLIWSATDLPDPKHFLRQCRHYARVLGISPASTNFIDACLHVFRENDGNEKSALGNVARFTRKSLREPTLSESEVQRFEAAIARYGTDFVAVHRAVGTQPSWAIVRFYYAWKKTERGHKVWDNCAARPSRKQLVADEFEELADEKNDDLWSTERVRQAGIPLICRHCGTKSSREWRRAQLPPSETDDDSNFLEALCARCGRLWFRYAVEWREAGEVIRLYQTRATKSTVEPELLNDAQAILAEAEKKGTATGARKKPKTGSVKEEDLGDQVRDETEEPMETGMHLDQSPPESRDLESKEPDGQSPIDSLSGPKADTNPAMEQEDLDEEYDSKVAQIEAEADAEAEATNTSKPEVANWCVVCCCRDLELGQLTCVACGLVVHAHCYGIDSTVPLPTDWMCDCCTNDRQPVPPANTLHACVLCNAPASSYTAWLAGANTGAPDALKPTYQRGWAHIRCAVVVPGVKFGDPTTLQPVNTDSRLFSAASKAESCTVCGAGGLPTVHCDECDRIVHVGCAGKASFSIGLVFDPKSNGPDTWKGQSGKFYPVVRCPEHPEDGSGLRPAIVPLSELDNNQRLTAMEVFVRGHKGLDAGVRPDSASSVAAPYVATEGHVQVASIPLSLSHLSSKALPKYPLSDVPIPLNERPPFEPQKFLDAAWN